MKDRAENPTTVFYAVFLKEFKGGILHYGCNYYDYEEGTLVFVGNTGL